MPSNAESIIKSSKWKEITAMLFVSVKVIGLMDDRPMLRGDSFSEICKTHFTYNLYSILETGMLDQLKEVI